LEKEMPTVNHEYTQHDLDAAVASEREAWQYAAALMLVARSGQVTDMQLAERLTSMIAADLEKRAL
jgi:hypothetical protein